MQEKLTIIDNKCVRKQNTLRNKNVRCYTLLDSFIWISGVLNNMFVSGRSGLASLPFHPQWSRFLQYV